MKMVADQDHLAKIKIHLSTYDLRVEFGGRIGIDLVVNMHYTSRPIPMADSTL